MVVSLLLWLACSGDGSNKPTVSPRDAGRPGRDAGGSSMDAGLDPDDESDGGFGFGDHAACLSFEEIDLLAALRGALNDASGGNDRALSDDGCLHMSRREEDGVVTRLSVRRWLGYQTPVFEGDPSDPSSFEVRIVDAEAVYVDLTTADDGSQLLQLDPDGDGEIDLEIRESYRGELLASRERTRLVNGKATARRVLTSAGDDTIHFKREALRDGELVTIEEFDAPAAQNQVVNDQSCYTPGPKDSMGNPLPDTIPCSDAFKQHMRERIAQAIDKGVACLASRSNELSLEQLELMLFAFRHGDSLNIECFQADNYVGQMVLDQGQPKMRVNPEMENCGNANFVEATLFHEVLHHIRGPHAGNDNDLGPEIGMDERAYTYSDSFRSCEAMCFGGIVNTCSCAACLETDTCDDACSDKPSCTVRDPNTNMYVMSEAVGALCQDPANKMNRWFSTMMACQSGCAFGAAQCKSYSLSCDDSCQ